MAIIAFTPEDNSWSNSPNPVIDSGPRTTTAISPPIKIKIHIAKIKIKSEPFIVKNPS